MKTLVTDNTILKNTVKICYLSGLTPDPQSKPLVLNLDCALELPGKLVKYPLPRMIKSEDS